MTAFVDEKGAADVIYLNFNKTFDTVFLYPIMTVYAQSVLWNQFLIFQSS